MPKHPTATTLLDADEILAIRENLEGTRLLECGPPARAVPLSLCAEISGALKLLEHEIRAANPEIRDH